MNLTIVVFDLDLLLWHQCEIGGSEISLFTKQDSSN